MWDPRTRVAIRRMVLCYVALGALWFFICEVLIRRFLDGWAAVRAAQSIAGLLFLVGTAAILYFLLPRATARKSNPGYGNADGRSRCDLEKERVSMRELPNHGDNAHLRAFAMSSKDFAVFRLRHEPSLAPNSLTVVFVSPAFERLWAPQGVGDIESWVDRIHEDHRQAFRAGLANALALAAGFDLVFRTVSTLSVDSRWLRCVISPEAGVTGRVEYLNGIVMDDTARMRDAQRLLRYRDQLRSLVRRLAETELVERQRIADFLHDETVQTLALASMRLSDLRQDEPPDEWRGSLYQIQDLLRRATDDCRNLTIQLSPPVLDRLGLKPALECLAEEFSDSHGVPCAVSWEGPERRFERSLEAMVYWSLRELLDNVARHAEASTVRIDAVAEPARFCVTFSDDGKGFETGRIGEDDGLVGSCGLFGIRERAEHLGGECLIQSSPGCGTQIQLQLPAISDSHTA